MTVCCLQVFYYRIPDGQDIVTIKVKNASEAVGCVFVSIQNNTVRIELQLDMSIFNTEGVN